MSLPIQPRVEQTASPSDLLRDLLAQRIQDDPEFWSFNALRSRSGNHALFQYPAMMVPELQGALLDDLLAIEPDTSLVYDPFSGSGTVMLESLYRGLDFHGSDINPLAILLCQVKPTPPTLGAAQLAIRRTISEALTTYSDAQAPDFPGVDKWFKPEIKAGLASLREAIKHRSNLVTRRFMWICFAETIRLVSNSRISTFKLHTYTQDEIDRRETDAIKVFRAVAGRNAVRLKLHWTKMSAVGDDHLPTATLLPGSVTDRWVAPRKADVLMTSPPYGDNKTTVPYGQHSYLPLRWIDTRDIPGGFDPALLNSTSRIDSLSLGGSLKHADDARDELAGVSKSLERFILEIDSAPPLRRKVLSFTRDYRDALSAVSARLKDGAFCFFTLGERRVGKRTFPLVDITRELLEAENHEIVTIIERTLPGSRKRMAAKNSEGATMAREWILVTRAWRKSDHG